MTRALLIALTVFVLAGCERQPAPNPVQPAATGPNAADAHRAAWETINVDLNMAAGFTSFGPGGLRLDEGSTFGSLAEARSVLERHADVARSLVAAAAEARCDFGFRFDPKKPHDDTALRSAGKLRSAARVLRSDAARLWSAGERDAAVERVEALFRMVGQLSDEPVLLVSLVNSALFDLGLATAKTMAEEGLTEPQKARLLKAIDALDRADPAGVEQAKAAERTTDAQIVAQVDAARLRTTSEAARVRRLLGAP